MRLSARSVREVLFEGTAHFFRSHGFVYSAAIAFNLLLASIPVLFLVFAATSVIIGRNELPFESLTSILKETFPYGAQVLVPILRELFASGTTFGIAGSLMLLVASFSATDAVHASLAVMQGTPLERTFRRSALFHMILVLTLIVLASAAIFVPPLWAGVSYLIKGVSGSWDAAFQVLLSGIAEAFLAGIIFLAGALTYRYLSPRRVQLENALAGSLIFLLLLYIIKTGFAVYVKRFSRLNIIYGSLFSIICFIIVAYLFAAAYLFCASIIGTLERKEGKEVFPGREQGAGTDGAAGGH
ncbi:MAG TPA: YihY/virulence factor BrkB family protein [Candidatus Limnocylindrales bacterium]|nr:YihY/virulence factor BrkB family protein [Candidatus Limnocylindrales bacterium]